jgi:hypothetical protein
MLPARRATSVSPTEALRFESHGIAATEDVEKRHRHPEEQRGHSKE